MRIHLKTLGCRLNEAELQHWASAFQKAGHQITREQQLAELIIINSCAVTQDAAKKSRYLIRRMHRDNPLAKIVVSGCYATLKQQEAEQLLGVDLVISNPHKDQLVQRVISALNMHTLPARATEPGENVLFGRGRQRAFIKVQDGCRYRCTFCIVTIARGAEQSRSVASIIEEINTLHQQGIKEIILTGVHLGGYGSDINSHLAELLSCILAHTDMPRIRLGSLEPWDLPVNFFELMQNPRMMPHLHLPLQSGSDSVLRRMARRCKTKDFARIAATARDAIADFNLTTDIMVGFPGETEQEWQESIDFINQIGFGHIHIFSYSPREGTKAASFPEPIDNTLKKQRSQQLHKLAQNMKEHTMTQNLGKQFPVLWEANNQPPRSGSQQYFGYTPNYLRVAVSVPEQSKLENNISPVVLEAMNGDYLTAKRADNPGKICPQVQRIP